MSIEAETTETTEEVAEVVPETVPLPRFLSSAEEAQIYTRHEGLALHEVEAATIIGTGGTGTWVAILLAMSGTKKLYLMDEDYLEVSNLNRLPYTIDELGKAKSEILKEYITAIRPSTEVITMPRVTDLNLHLISTTFIFDCTDRHDIQIMMSRYAKEARLNYIRVGYDGTHMTVTDEVPEWNVGDDTGGYTIVASWVVPAIMAACMGVTKAMLNPNVEVSHEVDDAFSSPEVPHPIRTLRHEDIFMEKYHKRWKERTGREKCRECGRESRGHADYVWCAGQARGDNR